MNANFRTCIVVAIVLATASGAIACSRGESSNVAIDSTPAAAALSPPASFVNRVWKVAESKQVAVGDVRVFLDDGTLVMTSPKSIPAFGSWTYANGQLTITEEGQHYPTDIVESTAKTFTIRMKSPGEPVEIRFELADSK